MKKLIVLVFLSSFAFYFSNPHLKFKKIDKNEIVINEIQIKNETAFDVQCAVVNSLNTIILKVTVGGFQTITVDVGFSINCKVYYSDSYGLDYEYLAGEEQYSVPQTFVISSSSSGSSSINNGAYSNPGSNYNPALIDKSGIALNNAIKSMSNSIDNNPAIWHNRALKKYNKGDYRGALPLFEEAIKRAKGDAYEGLYFYRRGMTLKKLGMSYCNDFNSACQLRNPDGCKAYKNYCTSNKQQNSYGNSSSNNNSFNKANEALRYNKSGISKQISKDYNGAIADYNKAIELKPDDAGCYVLRGVSKAELKDYYGAIADYTKAIELDPQFNLAYYDRGVSKAKLKDYYGAIADYTKAISLDPDDAIAYYKRGLSKQNLKDYYGAIADYNKVIELKPDDAGCYVLRGFSKAELKDYNGAIADNTKAIELYPDFAAAYVGRGVSKSHIKQNYCYDFKKACDLGMCDKYNKLCKTSGKSPTDNYQEKSQKLSDNYASIIIGSFGAKANAERQKQTLVREGFDNINISKVGNVYRVSVLVSGSKEKVQEVHKRVKVYHKSAWISYN
tara:strand:+ start:2755 stop:4434 length:1680 start_codon:yes stop_codon:yes gene_type:complete